MTPRGRRMLALALGMLTVPPVRAEVRVLHSSVPAVAPWVLADTPVNADERVGPLLVVLEGEPQPLPARGRRWATREELAALYGASPERYERARRWLLDAGFAVQRDSPHRSSITVEGTAGAVTRAFGVGIVHGRLGARRVRFPADVPRVPVSLGIRGVIGLDDLPSFRPLHRTRAIIAPGAAVLDGGDFATVYRTATLHAAGNRGGGRSIAILARSNFLDDDIRLFAERFTQIRPRPPTRVFTVPGRDPGLGALDDELEVLLDVQWAGAVAPDASVRVVIAGAGSDIPDALAVAVEERVGDIVSISFGLCEPFAGSIVSELFHELYQRAILQGQSVVVAAGDAGATDCAPDSPVLAINALAASPDVVAVGGTAVDPLFDEQGHATGYGGEEAWMDEFGAGGGGVSTLFGAPSFQAGLGYPAGRAVPDLALAASPLRPGYAMVHHGEALAVGGTSVGAPAVAGLLALAGGMRGEALGHVLPELYRLGNDQLGTSSPAGAFHDVVDGSNGFPAGVGFDLATGWGTPVGEILVPALATASPSSCAPLFTCTIPAGPRSDGCLLQWLLPDVLLEVGSKGIPTRTQRCRDGGACDVDGIVNKSCTLDVALCTNVVDPRLRKKEGGRACAPQSLGTPRIVRPRLTSGPVGSANRRRLEASLAALPQSPLTVRDACTTPTTVEIPVPNGSSFGTAILRASVPLQGRSVPAKVMLVCERSL